MAIQALFLLVLAGAVWAQGVPRPGGDLSPNESPMRGPDGKDRTQDLLKADLASNLKDLGAIKRLTEEITMELEKHDRHVLSVGALKKLDEVEKLTKRIRGRMKRF